MKGEEQTDRQSEQSLLVLPKKAPPKVLFLRLCLRPPSSGLKQPWSSPLNRHHSAYTQPRGPRALGPGGYSASPSSTQPPVNGDGAPAWQPPDQLLCTTHARTPADNLATQPMGRPHTKAGLEPFTVARSLGSASLRGRVESAGRLRLLWLLRGGRLGLHAPTGVEWQLSPPLRQVRRRLPDWPTHREGGRRDPQDMGRRECADPSADARRHRHRARRAVQHTPVARIGSPSLGDL